MVISAIVASSLFFSQSPAAAPDPSDAFARDLPMTSTPSSTIGFSMLAPHPISINETGAETMKIGARTHKTRGYVIAADVDPIAMVIQYPFTVGGYFSACTPPMNDSAKNIRSQFGQMVVTNIPNWLRQGSSTLKQVSMDNLKPIGTLTVDPTVGEIDLYGGIRKEESITNGSVRTDLQEAFVVIGGNPRFTFYFTIVMSKYWVMAQDPNRVKDVDMTKAMVQMVRRTLFSMKFQPKS